MNLWEFLNSGNNMAWITVMVFFVVMGAVQIAKVLKNRDDD